MNKKILFLIVGDLRPGFIKSIQSWEPIIESLKNVEILYVLKDQISLIPGRIARYSKNNIKETRCSTWWWERMLGTELDGDVAKIKDFIENNDIKFNIPHSEMYSNRIDYSFLYETLPFFNTHKCRLLLLRNIFTENQNNKQISNVVSMFRSFNEARDFIIRENINFDFCIKIRPDNITRGSVDAFHDLIKYSLNTNHLVVDLMWKQPWYNGSKKFNCINDQFAMSNYKNMMIYLNAGRESNDQLNGPHVFLLNYLIDSGITISAAQSLLKITLKPWKLQHNRYFKEFLYKNSANEYYSEFLTLLNQFNTSS